ncbi:MAG: class I SAM-dependent methyltransferase [Ktedonobacterales bacterium]|nr:class I SAM-dependent methyltransferase [Ktedonobacterales bacterium]
MPVLLDPEQAETRAIHDLIDFADKDIVDVGCGDGRMTWRFAARARSVLGLDPVAVSIAQARADTPAHMRQRVDFRVADITTADLPRAAFDVVVLSWSLC